MTPVLLLSLFACTGDPASGTAVGNPGKLDFTGTDVPDDVVLAGAVLDVAAVELGTCGGDVERIVLGLELDLLAAPTWPVQVEAGEYCSVVAELDGLDIAGVTTDGTGFGFAMSPDDLVLEQGFQVDGDQLLVGVPLPVDAALIEELGGEGEEVDFGGDDQEAQDLAQDVSSGATLGRDTDGDGQIDSDPVSVAPGESTEATGTSADSASSGCQSASGSTRSSPLLLWGLLALGWLSFSRDRRRRSETSWPHGE